jgi:hypothetical protein
MPWAAAGTAPPVACWRSCWQRWTAWRRAARGQRSSRYVGFTGGCRVSGGCPGARLQQLHAAAGADGRRGVPRTTVSAAAAGDIVPCQAAAPLCSCSLSTDTQSLKRMSLPAVDDGGCVTCRPAGVWLAPCAVSSRSRACAHGRLCGAGCLCWGRPTAPARWTPRCCAPAAWTP